MINHCTSNFTYAALSDELNVIIAQLDECVVNYSWKAVYAATEEECDAILELTVKYQSYDPDNQVYNCISLKLKEHMQLN